MESREKEGSSEHKKGETRLREKREKKKISCPPSSHSFSLSEKKEHRTNMTSPPKKKCKFVFVPAHITEPLEEWEVEYTEDQAVECLLDKVKVRRRGEEFENV